MINGIKVTQIHLIRKNLQLHHRKLKQISLKKSSIFHEAYPQQQYEEFLKDNIKKQPTLTHQNELSLSAGKSYTGLYNTQDLRLKNKRQNHVICPVNQLKSVTFHRRKREHEIEQDNCVIYQKLLKIKQRKDIKNMKTIQSDQKNPQKKSLSNKKMGKHFQYRKRQSMAIEATNAIIGQRLINKTGYYDHQKDVLDFHKTRQIINRIEKFNIIDRLMKKNPHKRIKTLPNKLPKLDTDHSQST